MASPGCNTLTGYNSEFNKWYNQCSAQEQSTAIRCYIRGLLPKYIKHLEMSPGLYTSLATARAAATSAVAKEEMIALSFNNFNAQKARSFVSPTQSINKNRQWSSYNRQPTSNIVTTTSINGQQPTVDLRSIADTQSSETEAEERHVEEEQVSVIQPARNNSNRSSSRSGYQLSNAEQQMLKNERRCFHCHKFGHISKNCRSPAATSAPAAFPLKGQAPNRT
jgi:hypothetical protein